MYTAKITYKNQTYELHDPFSAKTQLYTGVVTLVLNGISDFKFSLLPDHPLFHSDKLQPFLTMVYVYKDGALVFRGRVLDPVCRMSPEGLLEKEYVAESELAYLLDSTQRFFEFRRHINSRGFLLQILENHNDSVESDKIFTEGEVKALAYPDSSFKYLHYGSSLENIQEGLLDVLGGYLSVSYSSDGKTRYLNYKESSGTLKAMPIRLAENLQSIESRMMPSSIITKLIPLGAQVYPVEYAISRLVNRGVITASEENHWLQSYKQLTWLGLLLINMSKQEYTGSNNITEVLPAIEFLHNADVIKTPEYWEKRYDNVAQLQQLLIDCANMLNPEVPATEPEGPRLTLEGTDYIVDKELMEAYGIVEGTVVWDDITTSDDLRSRANAWLRNQTIQNSVAISALDLSHMDVSYEQFQIGNYYVAENSLLDIRESYQLIEQELDIVNPLESTLTFGDKAIKASNRG